MAASEPVPVGGRRPGEHPDLVPRWRDEKAEEATFMGLLLVPGTDPNVLPTLLYLSLMTALLFSSFYGETTEFRGGKYLPRATQLGHGRARV